MEGREPMIAHYPLAAAMDDLAEKGRRKILVTSCTPGEGKSSIAAQSGHALAGAGQKSVVLVDADPVHPRLHFLFGLSERRGVVELLEEVYLCDLAGEASRQFGVGDWLEILRAQGRSGELTVREPGAAYAIRVIRGSPCSIACLDQPNGNHRLCDALMKRGCITLTQKEDALQVQEETGRPIGEVLRTLGSVGPAEVASALQSQLAHRLAKIIGMRQPHCSFDELPEPYLPAAGERTAERPDHDVMRRVRGRASLYLKHPFLSSQVPSYLAETELPNLKLLPAGRRPRDLRTPSLFAPFGLLLDRLGAVFDLVLVDAPPISRTGPVVPFARIVDGVLLVVKERGAEIATVRRAVDELKRSGGNVIGIVLNRDHESREATLSPDDESWLAAEDLAP